MSDPLHEGCTPHGGGSSLGRCFKVSCSHGDERPPWDIYRRVIAQTSQVTECVRIEARADGSHVLYLADPITKAMLEKQTEIESQEFLDAVIDFLAATKAIPT